MRKEESLYFTQAELEVMLELSGGCAIYRVGPPPDDTALTQAFASLYQRGFLSRKSRAFLPDQKGLLFRELCAAPLALVLTARFPYERTAICYAGGGIIWIAETVRTAVRQEVRLRRMERREWRDWLFDAGMLETPLLSRADGAEFTALLAADGGIPERGTVRLRLEKYQNGGNALGVYEILDGVGARSVRIREGERETAELYTAEALESLLDRALQKGQL